MSRIPFVLVSYSIFVFFSLGCSGTQNNHYPVTEMTAETVINTWLAAGPFDWENRGDMVPDGSNDAGFATDFLKEFGGETDAVLQPGMEPETGIPAAIVTAGNQGIVDFSAMYHNAENVTAYAFAWLRSHKAQTVCFLLGSDDAVKVWVNGELVHSNYTFRAVNPEEDRFSVNLENGLNRVLIKVMNGVRGWGFSLKILDAEKWKLQTDHEEKKSQFMNFLNCDVVPDWYNPWDMQFYPGDFPDLRWSQPLLADKITGGAPLEVRWFDGDFNEVKKAENPGRYGYIAETKTLNGKMVRRAGTLYCWPWEWIGWSERPFANLKPLSAARLQPHIYHELRDAIAENVGRITLLSVLRQKEGAALMAWLHEVNAGQRNSSLSDNPLLADDEYHIFLQKKTGGVLYDGPGLNPPQKFSQNIAPVLKPGSPAEADCRHEIIGDVRAVCEKWYAASGEPFITLIARNGIIVYHEATGGDINGEFTTETATPMASITKLVTGVTFAQFMHQGLIDVDAPVGKFYPDFPVSGDKALTLRHCFTHTSGLIGHASWGGVHNHRLENIIASQLDFLPVGKKSTYNGDGYNLAGRVMEAVAGKSIFRIIRENLLTPLDMAHSVIDEDLAFSLHTTAGDIAKVGQMLLNRGSYGKYLFFSQEVFDQIIPKNLAQYYPGMDWEQGIGITWMTTRHPDAGKNGIAENKMVLGKNIIGHGSATSAVLRVDLDHNLVIAQTRRRDGRDYEKYLTELFMAIEQNLK